MLDCSDTADLFDFFKAFELIDLVSSDFFFLLLDDFVDLVEPFDFLLPDMDSTFPFSQQDTRVMRTITHAANNAATRDNNQSGSWRVPDNLWRIATPEQRTLFNELRSIPITF